ncbi:MAG: hypothetical protein ACKOC5_08600 [Chloroflexota bacterium]
MNKRFLLVLLAILAGVGVACRVSLVYDGTDYTRAVPDGSGAWITPPGAEALYQRLPGAGLPTRTLAAPVGASAQPAGPGSAPFGSLSGRYTPAAPVAGFAEDQPASALKVFPPQPTPTLNRQVTSGSGSLSSAPPAPANPADAPFETPTLTAAVPSDGTPASTARAPEDATQPAGLTPTVGDTPAQAATPSPTPTQTATGQPYPGPDDDAEGEYPLPPDPNPYPAAQATLQPTAALQADRAAPSATPAATTGAAQALVSRTPGALPATGLSQTGPPGTPPAQLDFSAADLQAVGCTCQALDPADPAEKDCQALSFLSVEQAQACYRYCLEQTGRDIYWLDADSDGLACDNGLER